MLRYRVLLIDTESSYKRPIQAFFSTMKQVDDWIDMVLPAAQPKAWVEIYQSIETELGRVNRTDLPLRKKAKQEEAERDRNQTEKNV